MNLNIDIKQLLQSLQSIRNIDIKQILRRTDLLVNLLIIAITLISIKALYQKQTIQIQSIKEKIKELEGTTVLIEKIENSEREIEDYLKKLPLGKDFPDIVDSISNVAKSNNVFITTVTQEQRKYSQQYYTLPVNLSINGRYYDIWNFLRDLENSQEFFTLENVRISSVEQPSKTGEDEKSSYCSASIKLFATSIKKD